MPSSSLNPIRCKLRSAASTLVVTIASFPFTATVAFADPAAPVANKLDLTDIFIALINAAFPAVAALATYLINAKVKDHQMASLLAHAVENGVGFIQHSLETQVRAAQPGLQINDPALLAGVKYVRDNAQEAIKHFSIPDDRIKIKLLAKLGLLDLGSQAASSDRMLRPEAYALVG